MAASAGRYPDIPGTSGIEVVRAIPASASMIGRSGTGFDACTARPRATVKPRASACTPTSLASLDLPTPGSPARNTRPVSWPA